MTESINRPWVVCHMLSSLDGKIDGDYFVLPQIASLREANLTIRAQFQADAILNGAVTCAEIYADGYAEYPEEKAHHLPRTDYVAKTDLKSFVVCVDPKGGLQWSRNFIDRRGQPKAHVIEALSENVPDACLMELQRLGISYIFAGKERLDMKLMLEKLQSLFGIQKVLTTGGGQMNWSLLQAGCLDELSLIVASVTDGRTDTASLFDRSPFCNSNAAKGFRLQEVKKLSEDGVWLRYTV